MVAFWAELPAGPAGIFTRAPVRPRAQVIRTGDPLFGSTVVEISLGGLEQPRRDRVPRPCWSNGRQVMGRYAAGLVKRDRRMLAHEHGGLKPEHRGRGRCGRSSDRAEPDASYVLLRRPCRRHSSRTVRPQRRVDHPGRETTRESDRAPAAGCSAVVSLRRRGPACSAASSSIFRGDQNSSSTRAVRHRDRPTARSQRLRSATTSRPVSGQGRLLPGKQVIIAVATTGNPDRGSVRTRIVVLVKRTSLDPPLFSAGRCHRCLAVRLVAHSRVVGHPGGDAGRH